MRLSHAVTGHAKVRQDVDPNGIRLHLQRAPSAVGEISDRLARRTMALLEFIAACDHARLSPLPPVPALDPQWPSQFTGNEDVTLLLLLW